MELVRSGHEPTDSGRHEEVRLDVGPRISSMSSAVEGMDFEEEEHADAPKLSTRGMTVAFKVRSTWATIIGMISVTNAQEAGCSHAAWP